MNGSDSEVRLHGKSILNRGKRGRGDRCHTPRGKSKRVAPATLLVLAMFVSTCRSAAGPPEDDGTLSIEDLPENLQEFASSQVVLPIQSYERIVAAAPDTFLFRMDWGEPQDCPSGCFYLGAYGLVMGQRLGWVTEGLWFTSTWPEYFRFSPGDSAQLTTEFMETVRVKNKWAYEDLRFRACCDVRSGEGLLFRIALQIHPFGDTKHAHALIDHPVAVRSERILEVILALPEEGYAYQRERARQALEDLRNGIEPPPADTVVPGVCALYHIHSP